MENTVKDNYIVGWHNGKAIVIGEDNELYYYEMPEEYAFKGELLDTDELKPLDTLPAEEVIEIMDHLSKD